MSQQFKSVAVLGGGFMGAGIAESASLAEHSVVIRELPQFLDAARARVARSLDGAVKRGKLDRILERYEPPPWPIHVVHREGRHVAQKARAFVDLAVERLRADASLR